MVIILKIFTKNYYVEHVKGGIRTCMNISSIKHKMHIHATSVRKHICTLMHAYTYIHTHAHINNTNIHVYAYINMHKQKCCICCISWYINW